LIKSGELELLAWPTEKRFALRRWIVMAGPVLAVVLIVGLGVLAWIESRAATGHPIRLPELPRIDVDLPLRGRALLVGEALIVAVSVLIIMIDLAIIELLP
jgi:hypothetical protein